MDDKRTTESSQTSTPPNPTDARAATTPQKEGQEKGHEPGNRGESIIDQAQDTLSNVAGSTSEAAQATYDQGRHYARQFSERYPEARRYYEQGSRAVSQGITEAPLTSLLAVGALGYLLAWAIHGDQGHDADRTRRKATRRDPRGRRTGKPLIESDRVEGTAVYDRAGKRIGTIERVMIETISGRVAYAVMSFGGFFGFGADEYAVPWGKLDYDTTLEGYRTDLTKEQLQKAPDFSRDQDHDWSDRQREQELHDYYQVAYYWLNP